MSFLSPPQGFQAVGVSSTAFPLLGSNGSASAPTYSFSSSGNSDTGMFLRAGGALGFTIDGLQEVELATNYLYVKSAGIIGWNSGALGTGSVDVLLARDAAAVLALKNGTTAQTFRVYNTFTDASNYERLSLSGVTGTSLILAAETAGTGADNLNIVLTTAGTGIVTTPTGISIGTNPAASGQVRLANSGSVVGRNAANNADINMLNITSGNVVVVGVDASSVVRLGASGGSVGFYATTPVALQTGVAVTAAGIHAALVNLGLITA